MGVCSKDLFLYSLSEYFLLFTFSFLAGLGLEKLAAMVLLSSRNHLLWR